MSTESRHTEPQTPDQVGRLARSALVWSLFNTVASRLGSILISIVMARILMPADYGIYAVAAVALNALLSVNELGVSLAIVRWPGDPKRIAPSVNAVAVISSLGFFLIGFALAPSIAGALNTPEATGVLRLLLMAAVIDGITSVPAGLLTRDFRQKARAFIDLGNLLLTSTVCIVLALGGAGAWSLAVSQLAGSCFMAAAILMATRPYPGFAYDRGLWVELVKFGLPLAAASGLVFLMLNLDNIVVGAVLGTEALGIYFLAFNLSNYPVAVISMTMRRVALAAYSRLTADTEQLAAAFVQSLRILLSIALPACVALGMLAQPIITVVYGSKWNAAAAVLGPLAALSAVRIVTELIYDLLVAVGWTRRILLVQCAWVAFLAPMLVLGAYRDGVRGVAVAHVAVALLVALPLYVLAIRKVGIATGRVLRAAIPAAIASLLVAAVVLTLEALVKSPALLLLVGLPLCVAVAVGSQWRVLKPFLAIYARQARVHAQA